MLGMMQNRPLLISTLASHAAVNHANTEIISRLHDETVFRYDYARMHVRAKKLAQALNRMGVSVGDRIGTLAWNTHRHLELYYGISGIGAICHTVNPRLFFDQIRFICNHAEDSVMFFDLSFLELVEKLKPVCPTIRKWVALCAPEEMPKSPVISGLLCYEELIGTESGAFEWPALDENTASSLCYTSGTTGDPKGILYSHRSTVLHAYASTMPDCFNMSARDVIMPASSMYHANAWGVPYATTLTGATLVLPGAKLDGASLYDLIEQEGVTLSFGVPTIWLGLSQHLERLGAQLSHLKRLVIGGAACPLALMTTFRERYNVEVVHLWGMTETSPLGTVNTFKRKHERLTEAEKDEIRIKQGRTVYGVELEIVDANGKPLPHDGIAFGDLLIRGWWIASGYYKPVYNEERNGSWFGKLRAPNAKPSQNVLREGGWFHTGDVATLDADGYMRITDRSKDVIKSGGEWISSIDLENAAIGYPKIAEAAVIGVRHPKWDERPLLIIVPKAGAHVSKKEILDYLSDKVAKWWLPDDVIIADEIPHTATGKILKTELRTRYADHLVQPQHQAVNA